MDCIVRLDALYGLLAARRKAPIRLRSPADKVFWSAGAGGVMILVGVRGMPNLEVVVRESVQTGEEKRR